MFSRLNRRAEVLRELLPFSAEYLHQEKTERDNFSAQIYIKQQALVIERPEVENIQPENIEPVKAHGSMTTIWRREWANQYRITCRAHQSYTLPPQQSGDRVTSGLTDKAKKKITDSCHYCEATRNPYKTFLTLTLDKHARERIKPFELVHLENGIETHRKVLRVATVQKEVSRFFDSMQKKYQRENNGDKLRYLWVAEMPKNEAGEDNPHIHVLLAWHVKHEDFKQWAADIESLWGQGFAHLEKIHGGGEAASAYIAKAANYISKGAEQGEIFGNRYNISKAARAPEWEPVKTYAWGIMGKLIEAARFKQKRKTREAARWRDVLMTTRDAMPKAERNGKISYALKAARQKIESMRGGFRFMRNCVIVESEELLNQWLWYAKEAGWQEEKKPMNVFCGALDNKLNRIRKFWESLFMPSEYEAQMITIYEAEAFNSTWEDE